MNFIGNTPVLKGKALKYMFEKPLRLNSKCITMLYKHNPKGVAFVVKRSAYRTKVQRNYLKRILREYFRKNENLFPANYKYVFIMNCSKESINALEIEKEFIFLSKKIKS